MEFFHDGMVDQFCIGDIDDKVVSLHKSDVFDLTFKWNPVTEHR